MANSKVQPAYGKMTSVRKEHGLSGSLVAQQAAPYGKHTARPITTGPDSEAILHDPIATDKNDGLLALTSSSSLQSHLPPAIAHVLDLWPQLAVEREHPTEYMCNGCRRTLALTRLVCSLQ